MNSGPRSAITGKVQYFHLYVKGNGRGPKVRVKRVRAVHAPFIGAFLQTYPCLFFGKDRT